MRRVSERRLRVAAGRRAVVTENAADYARIVSGSLDPHWGLVLTTNRQFPRHRSGLAVSALVRAFDVFLRDHPDTDEPTSEMIWLQPVP